MNNTAPKSLGILAVAVAFGLIGAAVAWVMWEMGLIASVFVGVLVGIVVAILLMLGWREPANSNASAPTAPAEKATASAETGAVAAAPATAAPVAAPAAAEVAAAAVAVEPTIDPKPAAKAKAAKPKAAAKTAAKKPAAKKPAAEKPAPKAKAAARPVAPDGKPELLTAAREGGPDDLKQIKGVGPKMEGMLHDMGIFHFDQVASWRKKEVEWVDANLEGFNGRVARDEWVKQAKVLARGGTTEFSSKVKKGGVY